MIILMGDSSRSGIYGKLTLPERRIWQPLGSDQSADSEAGRTGWRCRPVRASAGAKAINPWGLGTGPHVNRWSASLLNGTYRC